MRIDINKSKELFVEHGKAVEEVLRGAVRQALLEHKRADNPVASWKDGKVILLSPDEIPICSLKHNKSNKSFEPPAS